MPGDKVENLIISWTSRLFSGFTSYHPKVLEHTNFLDKMTVGR